MIDPNFRMTNALEGFKTKLSKEERMKIRQEKVRREKSFNEFVRNTQIPSFSNLKKEADDLYDKKIAEENALIAGADAGTLKSESLKKKAIIIKAKREKEAAKKAAPADKIE